MQELFQQIVNGISWGSIYSLIALGYTMVYGILRFVNFAHGDVYMVGAFFGFYAAGWLGASSGAGFPVIKVVAVFAVAMIGAALLGIVLEQAAYKPVRRSPKLTAPSPRSASHCSWKRRHPGLRRGPGSFRPSFPIPRFICWRGSHSEHAARDLGFRGVDARAQLRLPTNSVARCTVSFSRDAAT